VKDDSVPFSTTNLDQSWTLRAECEAVFDLPIGSENYNFERALDYIQKFPFSNLMAVRANIGARKSSIEKPIDRVARVRMEIKVCSPARCNRRAAQEV
jgi:hypothetical protein